MTYLKCFITTKCTLSWYVCTNCPSNSS